jgi:hypothetical protein
MCKSIRLSASDGWNVDRYRVEPKGRSYMSAEDASVVEGRDER